MNLDLTYQLAESWSLHTSYAFHTGWPSTLEDMHEITDEKGATAYVIKPEAVYGTRLPDYHRLDVRATRRVRTGRGDLRLFFELSNLTNHQNVFGYDYYRELDATGRMALRRDVETGFIIVPSLGLSWSGNLF